MMDPNTEEPQRMSNENLQNQFRNGSDQLLKMGMEEDSCRPRVRTSTYNFAPAKVSKQAAHDQLSLMLKNNMPQHEPVSPLDDPPKRIIYDKCGREIHLPKIRAREICKRLCAVPSVTKELDDVYQDYFRSCPEDGEVDGEGCQYPYMHHHRMNSSNVNYRKPRRSILKEHLSAAELIQQKHLNKQTHVQFDKYIELISAITSVNGLDASLRKTGRNNFLRQLKRDSINKSNFQSEMNFEQRPLLSIKSKPMMSKSLSRLQNEKTGNDDDYREARAAKQDLARLYFTNKATRLVACANLGAFDTNSPFDKQTDKKLRYPHLLTDHLTNDIESARKRKEHEKNICTANDEMSAFNNSFEDSNKNPNCSTQPPETSLNDLKLKVEIMKKERERDVQAAAQRNRRRKACFRQMLPSFADVIRNDLTEYSIQRAGRLSEEELCFADTISMDIASYKKVFEEPDEFSPEEMMKYNMLRAKRHNDLQMQKLRNLFAEFTAQDYNDTIAGMNKQLVTEILDVIVDVVMKVSEYREETNDNPPDVLYREWKNSGFVAINEEYENDDHIEEDPAPDDEINEEFVVELLEVILDVVGKNDKYKQTHGESPDETTRKKWIASGLAGLNDEASKRRIYSKILYCNKTMDFD